MEKTPRDLILSVLLKKAKIIFCIEVILVGGAVLAYYLNLGNKERPFTMAMIVVLCIGVFTVIGIIGLINAIKLLKYKVFNIFLKSFFIFSILCLIPIAGVFKAFIVSSIDRFNHRQEIKKESRFFHERYIALQKKFKEQQVVLSYSFGELMLGSVDAGETILLGQTYVNDPESYSSYWNGEKDSIVGKTVKVVLPDEMTFKNSYSCDGPYQDCILHYPKFLPQREYFYANVYFNDVLLNNEYTQEEQNFAKQGYGAISERSRMQKK